MLSFVSSLIRSQRLQDTAGIIRGIYRVNQGFYDPSKGPIYVDVPSILKKAKMNLEQEKTLKKESQHQTVSKKEEEKPNQSNTKQQQQQEIPKQPKQDFQFKEQKVPETAIQRAFQFGMIGVSLAKNAAKQIISSKLSSNNSEKSKTFKEAIISEENANLLAGGLCKMRGAPLKLAQALSIQEDKLIPKSIRLAFERARQSADSMPSEQLTRMLEQELGSDWKTKFESFNEKPFAAASIGQVHRAILKDKTEVAVKVQYPGVKQAIDSDLNNLRRIMNYTNIFPKTMYMDKLIHNTKLELHQECDYKKEAEKQMKYRELLLNDKRYIVPKIFEEYSTDKILTSEYLEGVMFQLTFNFYQDDLDFVAEHYPQHLRNEIGKRIMELTLRELFSWRFMQSDPNPSNFYFNQNTKQLILLDFGAAHEYAKEFIDGYIDIIFGAASNNPDLCLQKSIDIGFLTGQESLRMKQAHVESVMTVGMPFKMDGEFDFGNQDMTGKIYELIPVMLKHRQKPPPPEVYSLHRKLSGSYLMNMRMKTKVNCRDIFLNLYDQYQK